ncbi:MAG TPA: hypothetical protein VE988_15520, partial [Gemmataceae bacterium]|nr:hypothetical protein [Gemmataceae bacterium]
MLLVTGCLGQHAEVEQNLMAYHANYRPGAGLAESYAVVCPDVLEVDIDGRPELSGPHPVGIDGRIDVAPLGRPRVEGETVVAIARQLGDLA